jgi:calcineurin-like phosphoesterase family protein
MDRKIFVIGDTHFLHHNIKKYCDRPDDYNTLIVKNWNSVVSENDLVIHLGDFSASVKVSDKKRFDILKKISNKLNGEKILIRGNHDYFDNSIYINELGFSKVLDFLVFEDILFSHYPLMVNEYTKKKEKVKIEELKNIFKKQKCKKVIHGHTHQRNTDLENHINCSVEVINYTPVSLSELLSVN